MNFSKAWIGTDRPGVVWSGRAWFGVARHGEEQDQSSARRGWARSGRVRRGQVWRGQVWRGMAWDSWTPPDLDPRWFTGQGTPYLGMDDDLWELELERRDREMEKQPPSATAMQELVEWSEAA